MQTAGVSGPLEVAIDSKIYRGANGVSLEAVRGLAFSLPAGAFGAMIGESGCGKTTALRIAAGLDDDFEGFVRRPERREAGGTRLGIVFQEPRLLPWRTVEANVRLVLPPERQDARLGTLFETLGLSGHLQRYPGELSLGLARRTAIARAFAIEPDLLLLDEPFVSLDEGTAARLRAELADLVERTRTTTLMVTHDIEEALLLADRMIVLSNRPAHVVADMPVERPRGGRDAGWIAEMRIKVEKARMQATLSTGDPT